MVATEFQTSLAFPWEKLNFPEKSRRVAAFNLPLIAFILLLTTKARVVYSSKTPSLKWQWTENFCLNSVLIRINQCCKQFKISLTFLQKYRLSLTQKTIPWLFPDLEEFFSLTTSRPVMSGFLKITGTASVCTERLHYLLFHQRFLDHPDLRGDRGDRNLRLRRQHRGIPSLPGRPEIWATPNRSVLEKPY